ncbi:hypothetical protein M407DRAFT_24528 [Tulasnella calospora MUT 4182]|uniref:Uncharacterized protein n=1 Tax=Tulasnella calospora MUT 4182 TaxID=1051891 RepID=A0A0C3KXR6_9AGAM|nr:hypothetical protein M407DRAFT_24528 [Tulasnella calospora MUT 4182]
MTVLSRVLLDPSTRVAEASAGGGLDPRDEDFGTTTLPEWSNETGADKDDDDDGTSRYSEEAEDLLPFSGSESEGEGCNRGRDSEADYSASEDEDLECVYDT